MGNVAMTAQAALAVEGDVLPLDFDMLMRAKAWSDAHAPVCARDDCGVCRDLVEDAWGILSVLCHPAVPLSAWAQAASVITGFATVKWMREARPGSKHEAFWALVSPRLRRQVPFLFDSATRKILGVSRFVADFYDPEQKLIVEIDGPGHRLKRNAERDRQRDEMLLRWYGVVAIRLPNAKVEESLRWRLSRLATAGELGEMLPKLRRVARRFSLAVPPMRMASDLARPQGPTSEAEGR